MAGHNHSLLVWLIVLLLVFNGIKSIPLNQFLPFGEPANDAMLPESFDTSATLQLSNFVKFYNETYGAAQVRYKFICSAEFHASCTIYRSRHRSLVSFI